MTLFRYSRPDQTGIDRVVAGLLEFSLVNREEVGGRFRIQQVFSAPLVPVQLDDGQWVGQADVTLPVTGPTQGVRVRERLLPNVGSRTYTVVVPNPAPLYATDLVEVDPATLTASTDTVPAWEAITESIGATLTGAQAAAGQAEQSAIVANASAGQAADSATFAASVAVQASATVDAVTQATTDAATSASASATSAADAAASATAADASRQATEDVAAGVPGLLADVPTREEVSATTTAQVAGDRDQVYHVVPGATANPGLRIYPTIADALTALTAAGNVGIIDLGTNRTHQLSAGITLDATRHELRGGPRCVIDCSSMTTGTAITVVGNPPEVGTRSARAVLTDIELVGPGSTSTVDAIFFGDATTGHGVYHLGPTRVHASYFRRAFSYGNNVWAITLWNCTAHDNAVVIYFPTNTSAAGERISFVSCTFHENTLVAQGGHGGGAFFFDTCSMTYNTQFIILTGGHKAFLSQCHLETQDTGTAVLFTLSHSASYLEIMGGIFMIEGTTAIASRLRPSFVSMSDGYVTFSDVFMQGIGLASGAFATVTGNGVVEIRGTRTSITESNPAKLVTTASGRNLLADGGMEQAGAVWDKWAIINDTATITNRLTGTNINLATSTDTARTGTRSLKATINAQASTTRFGLLVPVRPGRPMTWELYLAIPGAQTGNVAFQGTWVAENAMSTYGVPLFNNLASESSLTVTKSTSAALTWTVWDSGTRLRYPPPAATHLLLRVDVSGMGAGPIYIDDAAVYLW